MESDRPVAAATVGAHVVTPESLPPMKRMHSSFTIPNNQTGKRFVDYNSESSASTSTYVANSVHPYVELGKQFQELRELMRQSCSPDTARVSRASLMTPSEYGRDVIDSTTADVLSHAEGDHEHYEIKISDLRGVDGTGSNTHSHPKTPKRPPRYAVITPEESLMEAISQHHYDADHSLSHHPPRGTPVNKDNILGMNDTVTRVYEDSNLENSNENAHSGEKYWKQLAHDLELQLEEAEKSYAANLLEMNGEHEDLEERQQSLLEDMGARLSHALRGEQFWKQTLKKVMASRKRKNSVMKVSVAAHSNDVCDNENTSLPDVQCTPESITSACLRQELISEGIEMPSFFDLSVSTSDDHFDELISKSAHEKIVLLEAKLSYESNLHRATTAYVELLRKQNAALAASVSEALRPGSAGNYRATLRQILSGSDSSRMYSSADGVEYSRLLDFGLMKSKGSNGNDSAPNMAEFEAIIKNELNGKLSELSVELEHIKKRHLAELKGLSESNKISLAEEKERVVANLKDQYSLRLKDLEDTYNEVANSNTVGFREVSSELKRTYDQEINILRRRLEGEYAENISILSRKLKTADDEFAADREKILDEYANSLEMQKIELHEQYQRDLANEVTESKSRLELLIRNHATGLAELRAVHERELADACLNVKQELKMQHQNEIDILKKEIESLENAHEAALVELRSDQELLLEESKLELYNNMRSKCDTEIMEVEREIKSCQKAHDIQLNELNSEFERFLEHKKIETKSELDRACLLEKEALRNRLRELKEVQRHEIYKVEEEHRVSLQEARDEVLTSIERRHKAERNALLSTLNTLKASLAAMLQTCSEFHAETLKNELNLVISGVKDENADEIGSLQDDIVATTASNLSYIEKLRSENLFALEAECAAVESRAEADYLADMCRISGEIDLYKLKLSEAEILGEKCDSCCQTEKIVMQTSSTSTKSDLLSDEMLQLEESLMETKVRRQLHEYFKTEITELQNLVEEKDRSLSNAENELEGLRAGIKALSADLSREGENQFLQLQQAPSTELSELRSELNTIAQCHSDDIKKYEEVLSDLRRSQSFELEASKLQLENEHEARVKEIQRHRTVEFDNLKALLQEKYLEKQDENELLTNRLDEALKQLNMFEDKGRLLKEAESELNDLRVKNETLSRELFEAHRDRDSAKSRLLEIKDEASRELLSLKADFREVRDRFSKELNENSQRLVDTEKLLYQKTTECEELMRQLQTMFSLIDNYRSRFVHSENLAGIEKLASLRERVDSEPSIQTNTNVIGHHNIKPSTSYVKVDGVEYSSDCLMDALRITLKRRNSAQALCRQQQLCIISLRLLLKNTEEKHEAIKRKFWEA